ncbi:Ribonuclease H-like protein [Metarhizium robertsii ARSEF 23]|uniref:Ribonuclease H-like protein n=1 Tax=Metarhizium robertsii (strain ARSEF 23 / ATCC MYA-3075) TaxID=655844 RepID=A0A0B2XHC6_METRA|nr:Ribonuclease H-like protein [Metarhizium robertsii ARSEF 23]KHO11389.1 Ribonuclease H-like protein [Metarhizium robertsii ARSEF 23]
MIHGAVGSLFHLVCVEWASGSPAIAGLGGPIAPSLEAGIKVAKVVVPASIALLLGLAATDLDTPSADGCAQGAKGKVGGVAVGKVDEAVAWVPPADGVRGYMEV